MSVGEFTASNIAMDQDKEDEKKKGTVDYAKLETDITASKELASKGNFNGALESLLILEKQQRLAEDITATKMACTAILDLVYEAKEWRLLNEQIILLAKRRSQLKQAVQAFVRQAMGYIDHTPDKETKVELIKTLQTVTEGKIYVEIERARLTKRYAQIKESEGDVNEAAEILQEVAVETFGAMAKTEKIAFILQQVRLCLDRKDFVRAQILSRKISPKAFQETAKKGQEAGEVGIEGTTIEHPEEGTPSLRELKLQYYQLLIRYHAHSDAYLEVCRCYRALFEDAEISADPDQWQPILKKICWFVVLSPASSDQVTLLNLTAADKKVEELPVYKDLLQLFITQEIAWWWKIEETYASEMQGGEVFGGEAGAKRKRDLQARVTEHNILVVSKYYGRMRMARLATLLDLPEDKTEEALSELVVSKAVTAKIDRPSGVIRFSGPLSAAALLNTWSRSISKLLEVVERSCQQIQKESMVHRVPIGSS